MKAAAALVALSLAVVATPTTARATQPEIAQVAEQKGAFDRAWALSVYGTGLVGSYNSNGIGFRIRLEPIEMLGIEVFAHATFVDWPTSFRHDYPVGFNLYVPFEVADGIRLRALAGLCATFSFIEPVEDSGPRADDVLFGFHAGAGAEFAISSRFSLFVDAQWRGYLGHDRQVEGWTGVVGEELRMTHHVAFNTGLSFHL